MAIVLKTGASRIVSAISDFNLDFEAAESPVLQLDDAGSGVSYVGKAAAGSATSSAIWQIFRITDSGTPADTVIEYADGNDSFDNVWDDRVSLSYS